MSVDPSTWQADAEETPGMMSVCASSDCRTGGQSDAAPRHVPTRRQMFDAHRRGANKGMVNGVVGGLSLGIVSYGRVPEGEFHPDTTEAAEQRGFEKGTDTGALLTVVGAALGGGMRGASSRRQGGGSKSAPTVMGDEGFVVESAQAPKKFPNLFPEDAPQSVRSFRLEQRGGKWVTISPSGNVFSPKGRYIFVVQDGSITVARQGSALGGIYSPDRTSPRPWM
jgi:hypothetical protein